MRLFTFGQRAGFLCWLRETSAPPQPEQPIAPRDGSRMWKRLGGYEIKIHAWTNDRAEAQRIEAELIVIHQPPCNHQGVIHHPPPPVVGARIPQAVKDGLDEAAREDARTTSRLMAKILMDWLDGRKKKPSK